MVYHQEMLLTVCHIRPSVIQPLFLVLIFLYLFYAYGTMHNILLNMLLRHLQLEDVGTNIFQAINRPQVFIGHQNNSNYLVRSIRKGSNFLHNSGHPQLWHELLLVKNTYPNFFSLLNINDDEKP